MSVQSSKLIKKFFVCIHGSDTRIRTISGAQGRVISVHGSAVRVFELMKVLLLFAWQFKSGKLIKVL